MTGDQITIFAILAVTIVLFIRGPWRHDMVALGALLACVLCGLIEPEDAFAGFGHPAVVTVACVLILSRGLQNTGAMDVLAQKVIPKTGSITLGIAALTGVGALMSGFMNNVGAMALLMPVAIDMAAKYELPPGRVLMPLSFGTILGGMTTLIGTPPNLIVSGFRASSGAGSFGMFDFTPVGLAVALLGVTFVALVGWRLVPERTQAGAATFDTGTYFTEAVVEEKSSAAGKSLAEIEAILQDAEAQVVGLVRNEMRLSVVSPGKQVQAGDILVIEAEPESLAAMLSTLGLRLVGEQSAEEAVQEKEREDNRDEELEKRQESESVQVEEDGLQTVLPRAESRGGAAGKSRALTAAVDGGAATDGSAANDAQGTSEAEDRKKAKDKAGGRERKREEKSPSTEDTLLRELVVLPDSSLIGRSAANIRMRTYYEISLLAISRQGRRSVTRLRSTPLRVGDALLMMGSDDNLNSFAQEQGCVPLAPRSITIPDRSKAAVALVAMALAVAGAAFGLLPAAISFAACALAYMVLKILPLRDVYSAIDGSVVVLLAALIPVAGAMETTGAADLLAQNMLTQLAQGSAVVALVLLLVVTMTLSDFMNNAATAAVMCPIALGSAGQLDVNADSFLMAVAIGASCAFLTPVGHQNNTLILGPGGFRFGDYWRLGLPMEILVVLVAVPMLLWVWPL